MVTKKHDEQLVRRNCDKCVIAKVKCKPQPGSSVCQMCCKKGYACVFSLKKKPGPKAKTEKKRPLTPGPARMSHGHQVKRTRSAPKLTGRQSAPFANVRAEAPGGSLGDLSQFLSSPKMELGELDPLTRGEPVRQTFRQEISEELFPLGAGTFSPFMQEKDFTLASPQEELAPAPISRTTTHDTSHFEPSPVQLQSTAWDNIDLSTDWMRTDPAFDYLAA